MINLITISAPSGAGKTTICRLLQRRISGLTFSVSYTTRPKRGNEQEGVDYHFITKEEFEKKIKQGEFAEYEKVHDQYYGTAKQVLEDTIRHNRMLLLEVDVKGALSIKRLYSQQTLTLFILPPDIKDLETRLRKRGTESEQSIEKRLQRIQNELSYKDQFEYQIINDDVERATKQIIEIIKQKNEGVINGN
ncbi:MAG: guanylate kinase [Fidelibacterota bacterium]